MQEHSTFLWLLVEEHYFLSAVAAHGEIKSICMHHEQSAAFAAVAYADCKDGLGACMVSTGVRALMHLLEY